MARIKKDNINTREWWDSQHSNKAPHNSAIWRQFRRFFDLGHVPSDSVSVLDVGCGQALHFNDIAKSMPTVKMFGLDISSVVQEKNKEVAPSGEYLCIDVNNEEIPGIYDYVVSMHTFEHFDDPVAVLEKCKKVARQKVIILVPYGGHWNDDASHVHRFTIEDPFSGYVEAKPIMGVFGEEDKEIVYVFEGKANG